jgi:phage shock protein A
LEKDEPQGTQVERDVEQLACQLVAWKESLESQIAGVRTDSEVALLQQVAKLERRISRMEALVAEHVGGDVAEALLAAIADSAA